MKKGEPRIVATGTAWIGKRAGSIESALEELFRTAKSEVQITAYSITSGADIIFDWLETTLARGVLVTMIVDQLSDQPESVVLRLAKLAVQYSHFKLLIFEGSNNTHLHAKLIVVDRERALIGSSNLSRRGLVTNHELGIIVSEQPASMAARLIDDLACCRNTRAFVCQ
jgi:cardiolipin synthase